MSGYGCSVGRHAFVWPANGTASLQPFPNTPCLCGQTRWPSPEPAPVQATLKEAGDRSDEC